MIGSTFAKYRSISLKITSFALLIVVLGPSSAAQVKQPAVAFDPSFKSAEFADPARLDKIKLTFPTIEKTKLVLILCGGNTSVTDLCGDQRGG